jgi:hypothetical protein
MRKPVPGKLFARVKVLSYVELAIFTALIAFWLLPGFETETMVFGWAHGLGFVALCVVIWIACVRHEAPYTLLAATLTPVGPVGSVIGIELIEKQVRSEDPPVRLASAGPSGARTQGGRIAALFGRPRTPPREASAAARRARGSSDRT